MTRALQTDSRATELAEGVRRAMPIAKALLTSGIGELAGGIVDADDTIPGYVSTFVGHEGPDYDGHEQHRLYEEWTLGAYALGIAVGLHLRAAAFDK